MAAKSNEFENDILKLIFHGVAIPGLAMDSSSPLTSLWVALHSSDPGEDGTQDSFEVSYTPYERAEVARSPLGWTIVGNSVSPTQTIVFPECSSGTAIARYVSIGTSETGPGKILYKGKLPSPFNVIAGIQPAFATSSTLTEN